MGLLRVLGRALPDRSHLPDVQVSIRLNEIEPTYPLFQSVFQAGCRCAEEVEKAQEGRVIWVGLAVDN